MVYASKKCPKAKNTPISNKHSYYGNKNYGIIKKSSLAIFIKGYSKSNKENHVYFLLRSIHSKVLNCMKIYAENHTNVKI